MFQRLFARATTAHTVAAGSLLGASMLALHHQRAHASSALHSPEMPWSHKGINDSFDTASVRRGLMVYQQVCAACHSMQHVPFRYLVGVTHDVDGAKVRVNLLRARP